MVVKMFDMNNADMSIGQKFMNISWSFIILVTLTAGVGFAMLYSAAGGSWEPWAERQMVRYPITLAALFFVALIDIRTWFKLAYILYGFGLVLLVGVELAGHVGMGAKRWIVLGGFRLQPSEVMKIAMVLALARYFNSVSLHESSQIRIIVGGILILVLPVLLILRQPDLGTSLMLVMGGAVIFFIAGVRLIWFVSAGLLALAALPIAWNYLLRDYQKQRVLTFLSPESDPLGSGYHITQSKIAFGSGGIWGKGFMKGTQSYLNFLPEKQTDFIYTMLAEEFGFVGCLAVLLLFMILIAYGIIIGMRSKNFFGALVAIGVTTTFSLYVFINIAMIMGLIPVVGVPLPLISYGGTAMMTIMIGFGLLMNVHIHRNVRFDKTVGEMSDY